MKRIIGIIGLWAFAQIVCSQGSFYVESKETNIGKDLPTSILLPKIKSVLTDNSFFNTKTKEEAAFIVSIEAACTATSEFQGIFTSHASGTVVITATDQNHEFYIKTYNNIKGGGLSYENAGSKALVKLAEQMATELSAALKEGLIDQLGTFAKNSKPSEKQLTSDIDINIPETSLKNGTTYALIIGNEDYTKYQPELTQESNVLFARNDARAFSLYCEKTLGLPNENITLITDAISTQMTKEIERLMNKAKYSEGNIRLIFYYSGHGFPYDADKNGTSDDSYLIPVDVGSANIEDGISLSKLYSDLTTFNSDRVTVILDACFSGGGRESGLITAKAIKYKAKETAVKGNLIVFSASSANQESLFYREKKHGLFTYFLLKKLQESNGSANYKEIFDFVKINVPMVASDKEYKTQNPQVIISPDIEANWMNWTF